MTAPNDLPDITWRTASLSTDTGECVEVGVVIL
jgi:hypothetical protein